jgi:hypothetical protein
VTDAFAPLRDAYLARHRSARAAGVGGMPVVGLIGTTIPAEVVSAAGCWALPVCGAVEDLGRDAAPMETGHEAETRSLFRQVVAGELEFCDLLVIDSSSDSHRYLYQYLKEMQRSGRGARIPQLMLYDFLLGPSQAVERYSRVVLSNFAQSLPRYSGCALDAAAMAAAIDASNRQRRWHQALATARAQRRIGGTLAFESHCAAAFMGAPAFGDAVDHALGSLPPAASIAGPRVLLAASVPLYHSGLHAIMEQAGALVIGEDNEWGERRYLPEIVVNSAPMEALFAHYRQHAVSPRQPTAVREGWLAQRLGSGSIDGVVFHVSPDDQHYGWRIPALTAMAARAGVPAIVLREEMLEAAGRNALLATMQRFVHQITTARSTGVRA